MSKVVIFWTYIPKFFWRLSIPKFFATFFRHPQIFLDFIDLKTVFSPKNRVFRPKNSFLDLKISLNPLKTLRKHLFSLQIDEKKNIFVDFIAKNCPNNEIKLTIYIESIVFVLQAQGFNIKDITHRS